MNEKDLPFTLYKQPKSINFYIRYYMQGKEFRRSLGTPKIAEAYKKAYEIYGIACARAGAGLTLKGSTLDELIPSYFQYLDERVERNQFTQLRANQHKRIVGFYLSKFCGKEPIANLTTATINKFLDWRLTFWTKGPGVNLTHEEVIRKGRKLRRLVNPKNKKIPAASTIQMEQSGMWVFLEWLKECDYIPDNVKFRYTKTEHNARPAFTKDELQKFNLKAMSMYLDVDENEHRTKYKWRMFYSFCTLMLATGIRPTEARNLKWKHIIGFNMRKYELDDFIKISVQVYGKGKSRSAVPLPEIMIALDGLLAANLDYFNSYPEPDDYLFCNTLKKQSEDLDKMMNIVLRETDMEFDYRGHKRTTYSFRHTYITFQLISGINVYFLAKNTGTSVDMIKKHYDHSTVEQHRMNLIPEAYKKAMGLLMVNDSETENETKPDDKRTDTN